jgi:hypothetical protein
VAGVRNSGGISYRESGTLSRQALTLRLGNAPGSGFDSFFLPKRQFVDVAVNARTVPADGTERRERADRATDSRRAMVRYETAAGCCQPTASSFRGAAMAVTMWGMQS